MEELLGFVVWRRNRAKWEVLHSFAPDEEGRAHNTVTDYLLQEQGYDGHSDLRYTYGVSPVSTP